MINLLKFCKDLYKIPRSLTGQGVSDTLEYIKKIIPLKIKYIKSGTNVFDWKVPPEWNVKDAYVIEINSGKKIINFKKNNLHIIGYSEAVNKTISYDELKKKLFYIKDQPNAIPYITSYYKKMWGFCISYKEFKKLNKKSNYKIFIDSNFNYNGKLTYADFYIKGKVKQEIFFSSYICHPQMVNDQLSGPAVLTGIAEKLMNKKNYYSYRFVLAPETIGSIAYLSKNLDILKKNVIGGYNIACVGDEKNWGLINSRYGNNISEKIAEHVLKYNTSNFIKYSWLDRGSDERQYCAPGVELPISSITRSKYDEYPEYHTSLDNFNLVTKKGLTESLNIYLKCIKIFELNNIAPKINVLCEPQLSKRNLYPTISGTHSKKTENLMNFISYCDGKNSLLEISNLCKIEFFECLGYYKKIKIENLFSKED